MLPSEVADGKSGGYYNEGGYTGQKDQQSVVCKVK